MVDKKIQKNYAHTCVYEIKFVSLHAELKNSQFTIHNSQVTIED